jgi:hypothetical protein
MNPREARTAGSWRLHVRRNARKKKRDVTDPSDSTTAREVP